MEGEDFTPPAARIVEELAKWRERKSVPKADRSPRIDPDTAKALAHIGTDLAIAGWLFMPGYHLQRLQTPNQQDQYK